MSTLEKAIAIAANAHAGQLDKGGAPYILHCLRVMMAVEGRDEQIVAVLHDALEDTDVTVSDLYFEGFSDLHIEALHSVTKNEGETRLEAAHRAAKNRIGRVVKLADNKDNSDIGRIPNPTAADVARLAEYARVREILLAFKAPESELAEDFINAHCKANSPPHMDLQRHVQIALKAGCTHIEIKEAIESEIPIFDLSEIRAYLTHQRTLEAAATGVDLRYLSRGLQALMDAGEPLEKAYTNLLVAHGKNYNVRDYAICISSGCTEGEIKECFDAKLSMQFYGSLRKNKYATHSQILASCKNGIGTRELYINFVENDESLKESKQELQYDIPK